MVEISRWCRYTDDRNEKFLEVTLSFHSVNIEINDIFPHESKNSLRSQGIGDGTSWELKKHLVELHPASFNQA